MISDQIDFIRFIRLWNILWNGDFKDKLTILFIAHLQGSFVCNYVFFLYYFSFIMLDEQKRNVSFHVIFDSISVCSSSTISEDRSTSERSSSLTTENEETIHPTLPSMNQVIVLS